MRISVWSSDVCSSDLLPGGGLHLVRASRTHCGDVRQCRRPRNVAGHPASAGRYRCGAAAVGARRMARAARRTRSEEHTSELQSLMRISYAVFCLKKKKTKPTKIKDNTALRTQT